MNGYKSFSATVAGISHTRHDTECQDYSLHYDHKDMSVAIVADGHGDDNCFRSAKGAELAAKCAVKGIHDFIYPEVTHKNFLGKAKNQRQLRQMSDTEKAAHKMLCDLVKHIVMLWHNEVEKDLDAHPISSDELERVADKYKQRYEKEKEARHHIYGTTLIAAAITRDYWFGFHIGDGRFTALYADGSYDQPVPWDERCYLNVTTSICDDDVAETARVYFSFNKDKAPPLAVFLCSDGIDDNYPVEDNDKHLFKLYRTITQTFAEDGFDATCGNDGNGGQIKDLCTSFATKGKGDDTSLAGIIDMAMLADPKIACVYDKQIDGEKAEEKTEEEAENG
jgi:serine/threonine protein phosphatase PrpC